MCNLNNKSMLALLAVSLIANAANAEEMPKAKLVETSEAVSFSTNTEVLPSFSTNTEVLPSFSTNSEVLPSFSTADVQTKESTDERSDPKPPIIVYDGSGTLKSDSLDKRLIEPMPSLGDAESSETPSWSENELEADRSWTPILGGEMHGHWVVISGWTVINLAAQMDDSPLDIFIYDAAMNEVAAFDSTGCGAELLLEPQIVYVLIVNASKHDNGYKLNIFQ